MNGATAEPWTRNITNDTRKRTKTSGVSHQILPCQTNASSSRTVETFSPTPPMFMSPSVGDADDLTLFHDESFEHEHVHPAPAERVERFLRRVDDRLALEIEGGVEHERDPGRLAERLDGAVVTRIRVPEDGLQPRRAIDVRRRRHRVLLAGLHIDHQQHEPGGIVLPGIFQA